jgi:predicted nucleotidyltransferase/biotin operon repressor
MRTAAPPLLPIFRSQLQGKLLALLYSQPDRGYSLTELARRLSSHVATVQREAERLEEAGILVSERVGRTRLVRPNLRSPYAEGLSSIVMVAFCPIRVLGRLLSAVPGVERAYVFGSWAERYEGTRGHPPADIDVLVIGAPDRDAVDQIAVTAQEQVDREVSVTIRSHDAWQSGDDGFIQSVRAGNLVPIELEGR